MPTRVQRHPAEFELEEALSVAWTCARSASLAVPDAVACIVTGAYWFTSRTSFAHPASTGATGDLTPK